MTSGELVREGGQLTSLFEIHICLLTAIVHRSCDKGWIHIDKLALDIGLRYFRMSDVGLLGDPILTIFGLARDAASSII